MSLGRAVLSNLVKTQARRQLLRLVGERVMLPWRLEEEKGEALAYGIHQIPAIPKKIDLKDLHPNGLLYSDTHLAVAQAYITPIQTNELALTAKQMEAFLARLTDPTENFTRFNDPPVQSFFKACLCLLENALDSQSDLNKILAHFNKTIQEFRALHDHTDLAEKDHLLNEFFTQKLAELPEISEKAFSRFETLKNESFDFKTIIERLDNLHAQIPGQTKADDARYHLSAVINEMAGSLALSSFDKSKTISDSPLSEETAVLAKTCVESAAWKPGEVIHPGRNPKEYLNLQQGLEGVTKSASWEGGNSSTLDGIYYGEQHGKSKSGAFGKVKFIQKLDPSRQFNMLKVLKNATPDAGLREAEQLARVGMLLYSYPRLDSKKSTYEIVMHYVPGADMENKIPKTSSLWLCNQVLEGGLTAFESLHQRNILHLDIKEANMIFNRSESDNSKAVRPIDFGLSQESTEHKASNLKGTVNYMAPELLISDHASLQFTKENDVYALGISLARVFGMTIVNPLYKETMKEELVILLKSKELSQNGHQDVGFFKIDRDSTSINALKENPTLRHQIADLLIKMTDPNPENRPNLSSCLAILKSIPELRETKPRLALLDFDTASKLVDELAHSENKDSPLLKKLKTFDQVILSMNRESSPTECAHLLHALANAELSNLSNLALVSENELIDQERLATAYGRGVIVEHVWPLEKSQEKVLLEQKEFTSEPSQKRTRTEATPQTELEIQNDGLSFDGNDSFLNDEEINTSIDKTKAEPAASHHEQVIETAGSDSYDSFLVDEEINPSIDKKKTANPSLLFYHPTSPVETKDTEKAVKKNTPQGNNKF